MPAEVVQSSLSRRSRLESQEFANTTAIVTGASGGIGKAIIERLASAGANLVAVDVSREINSLADPNRLTPVIGDVTVQRTVERAFQAAARLPGDLRILVNCAFWEDHSSLVDVSNAGWDRTQHVCVRSPMRFTAEFAKRSSGRARAIVNVTSVHAFGAIPGYAAYEAAKAALTALTKSAAVELASNGIRCNAVAPGFVQVPRNRATWGNRQRLSQYVSRVPLKRGGMPAEVAHAVFFLASEAASFITGASLVVDGGMLARLPELGPDEL